MPPVSATWQDLWVFGANVLSVARPYEHIACIIFYGIPIAILQPLRPRIFYSVFPPAQASVPSQLSTLPAHPRQPAILYLIFLQTIPATVFGGDFLCSSICPVPVVCVILYRPLCICRFAISSAKLLLPNAVVYRHTSASSSLLF